MVDYTMLYMVSYENCAHETFCTLCVSSDEIWNDCLKNYVFCVHCPVNTFCVNKEGVSQILWHIDIRNASVGMKRGLIIECVLCVGKNKTRSSHHNPMCVQQ